MKSILNNDKACYICGRVDNLHRHHVFGGTANRALSEKYGLWVYLCAEHHNASNRSVHYDKALDLWLKRVAQLQFERRHTREEFVAIFGRNYL